MAVKPIAISDPNTALPRSHRLKVAWSSGDSLRYCSAILPLPMTHLSDGLPESDGKFAVLRRHEGDFAVFLKIPAEIKLTRTTESRAGSSILGTCAPRLAVGLIDETAREKVIHQRGRR